MRECGCFSSCTPAKLAQHFGESPEKAGGNCPNLIDRNGDGLEVEFRKEDFAEKGRGAAGKQAFGFFFFFCIGPRAVKEDI